VGDEIEIKPGLQEKEEWTPIPTKIKNIRQGNRDLKKGSPGGLLAVETFLDPSLTKADKLVGNVLGTKGKTPEVYSKIELEVTLMERILGTGHEEEIVSLKTGEHLLLSIGTAKTSGIVSEPGNTTKIDLKIPVCAEKGQKVVISRIVNSRWRLIGYGIIKN